VLSKSISGYGLPMSLLLIRPELDQWKPGEHTGTFRGNNLAFVAATEALRHWETPAFADRVAERGRQLESGLREIAAAWPGICAAVRGVGLIFGLELADPAHCSAAAREAFARGLVIEICGSKKNVLKFLPPLTIEPAELAQGLAMVRDAIRTVVTPPARSRRKSAQRMRA